MYKLGTGVHSHVISIFADHANVCSIYFSLKGVIAQEDPLQVLGRVLAGPLKQIIDDGIRAAANILQSPEAQAVARKVMSLHF